MSEYYRYLVREGSEMVKQFVVQAKSRENADTVVEETVLNNNQEVMVVEEVTHKMKDKETLQEFVNRLRKTDFLISTGGKYPTTIEAK